jgi:xanthine dehydrogenase YagS FAD-binding subunit
MLSSAILAGASQQLRNAASTGGNLLQRTRCSYFYDIATPCNKREPGTGCQAIPGFNRYHAILGASTSCIATHPSDMCVALAALEATVRVRGPDGERTIAFAEFHRLPGDRPELDTNLRHGEIILSVDLPPRGFARHHTYLWRDPEAEELLRGRPATVDSVKAAADHILRGAKGYEYNTFKIEFARRAIVRALGQAAAGTPQPQTDKRIH